MSQIQPAPLPTSVPDVSAYDGPLLKGALAIIDRLAAHALTPDQYQDEIARLFDRIDPVAALRGWTEKCLAERADQILYRKTTATTSVWFQLLHLRAREVHPPHCHRNLISNQVLLHGNSWLREYDRVSRIDDETIYTKLRSDGATRVGDRVRTTEIDRNAHWFCTDDKQSVQLNFFIVGYQDWLFDAARTGHRGRIYLDVTGPVTRDGLIVTKEIPVEAAEEKFQNRHINEFPLAPNLRAALAA